MSRLFCVNRIRTSAGSFFFFVWTAACVCFGGCVSRPSPSKALIECDGDLGSIWSGRYRTSQITLRNTSGTTAIYTAIVPSCGCVSLLSTQSFPLRIPPHGTLNLPLRLDLIWPSHATGVSLPWSALLRLQGDSPETIALKANIEKSISLDRTEIQLADLQKLPAELSKITISLLSPIKEVRAINPSKDVDLKVSPVNDNAVVISVALAATPSKTAIARSIDIFEAGNNNNDTLLGSLPIVGVLPSAVDIFPHDVALGTVPVGKAKELDLVVTSKLNGKIEASSDSPEVKSVSTSASEDLRTIVRVEFIPSFIGAITTVVKLNIRESKSTESFNVPISIRYYGLSE